MFLIPNKTHQLNDKQNESCQFNLKIIGSEHKLFHFPIIIKKTIFDS